MLQHVIVVQYAKYCFYWIPHPRKYVLTIAGDIVNLVIFGIGQMADHLKCAPNTPNPPPQQKFRLPPNKFFLRFKTPGTFLSELFFSYYKLPLPAPQTTNKLFTDRVLGISSIEFRKINPVL